MRILRSRTCLSLAGLSLALAACAVDGTPSSSSSGGAPQPTPGPGGDTSLDVADAWGPSGAPVPADAQLVALDDFKKALASGGRLLGPKQRAADEAAAKAREVEDEKSIADFTAAHPDAQDLTDLLARVPDPGDAALKVRADGDYDLRIKLANGTESTVRTLGPKAKRAAVAAGIRRFGSRENLEALYTHFYQSLSTGQRAAFFTSPAQLAGLSDVLVRDKLVSIVNYARDGGGIYGFATAGMPPDCNKQLGYGNGGDGSGYGAGTFAPTGLMTRAGFTNKAFVTCPKNQGSRGTCAAFAVTSALEMDHGRASGRFVNLSEQNLYAQSKLYWDPNETRDGIWPSSLLDGMSKAGGYTVPYEAGWNYNPSSSRKDDLTHSCDGYTETCSDTTHQSRRMCVNIATGTFCMAVTQDAKSSPVGYQRSHAHLSMSDHTDKAFVMNMLALMLDIGQRPAVVSLEVGSAFDSPGADGYVADRVSGSRGLHAVHVVGYVQNRDLPQGIPVADGGGYFVVKNSWGRNYGDGGFSYVPYTYMKLYAVDVVGL